MTAQKKIIALQNKIAKQTEKLTTEIQSICEQLDYQNSSCFSYNIDRLKQFNEGLQDFKIINYASKECGGIQATIDELCKPNGITIGY
jgi:hypothetical protein